jgi:hypothetical protein
MHASSQRPRSAVAGTTGPAAPSFWWYCFSGLGPRRWSSCHGDSVVLWRLFAVVVVVVVVFAAAALTPSSSPRLDDDDGGGVVVVVVILGGFSFGRLVQDDLSTGTGPAGRGDSKASQQK